MTSTRAWPPLSSPAAPRETATVLSATRTAEDFPDGVSPRKGIYPSPNFASRSAKNALASFVKSASDIEIVSPIKTIGLFPVRIKLHAEVSVNITVNVARTEEEGKLQQQRGAAIAAKAANAMAEAAEAPAVDPAMFDAPPAAEAAEEGEAKPKKRASKKKAAAEGEDAA